MWIVRSLDDQGGFLPTFYRRFTVKKPLQGCVLRISALGILRVKINGREIEDYFMPGWTNYNHYIHLCPYDITPYLGAENLIEVTVAEGWYSGMLGYTRKTQVYGDRQAIFAEITLTYADGEKETIVTDEAWQVGDSHIVDASLFHGETVDFTKEAQEFFEKIGEGAKNVGEKIVDGAKDLGKKIAVSL